MSAIFTYMNIGEGTSVSRGQYYDFHLEMHACHWSKSRHVTYSKSGKWKLHLRLDLCLQ